VSKKQAKYCRFCGKKIIDRTSSSGLFDEASGTPLPPEKWRGCPDASSPSFGDQDYAPCYHTKSYTLSWFVGDPVDAYGRRKS
jgi:hypothetical protein